MTPKAQPTANPLATTLMTSLNILDNISNTRERAEAGPYVAAAVTLVAAAAEQYSQVDEVAAILTKNGFDGHAALMIEALATCAQDLRGEATIQ